MSDDIPTCTCLRPLVSAARADLKHCAASELAEGKNRMLQQRVCWLPEPPVSVGSA
jgi:hypothetical protein